MRIFGKAMLVGLFACSGVAAMAQADDPETQQATVRIAGGGLTAGQPGLHPFASFEFGLRRAALTRRIADLSGGVSARGVSRGCGAHPLAYARFGTLTVYFRDDRFVGWSLSGPRARRPIESEWNLGIGTPRDEIGDADTPEEVYRQTAQGLVVDVDGMHGLLSGRGLHARITALWAGVTCRGR